MFLEIHHYHFHYHVLLDTTLIHHFLNPLNGLFFFKWQVFLIHMAWSPELYLLETLRLPVVWSPLNYLVGSLLYYLVSSESLEGVPSVSLGGVSFYFTRLGLLSFIWFGLLCVAWSFPLQDRNSSASSSGVSSVSIDAVSCASLGRESSATSCGVYLVWSLLFQKAETPRLHLLLSPLVHLEWSSLCYKVGPSLLHLAGSPILRLVGSPSPWRICSTCVLV